MVLILLGSLTAGIVVSGTLGFLVLFYGFPHHLIELALTIQRYQGGIKLKYIQIENSIICYAEKNSIREDKPTLVFLHGFTSSCNQWIMTFKTLQTGHHMIALDLPGHGRSSTPSLEELSIEFMHSTICNFLDSVGLKDKKVILIGTSFGGALSGVFASRHPDRVEKVSLICPAMITPVETELTLELRQMIQMDDDDISHKHCQLLPQDVTSIQAMFEACVYNKEKLKFSKQIFQGLLTLRLRHNDFFLSLLKFVNTEENLRLLENSASSISMPSQVIWGENDLIISSTGAKHLKSLLPDCRNLTVLDKCGHGIDLDRPYALCKALKAFIEDNEKKKE